MFLCSSIEELCRKEESDKTGCNFNFGHEYIFNAYSAVNLNECSEFNLIYFCICKGFIFMVKLY